MLLRIETLNYRVLRHVNQRLQPFQVLIGPNASGKSTFLDVIALMADIITQPSLEDVVRSRAPDLRDLTWMRHGEWLEIAIETRIPEAIHKEYKALHYEIRLGVDEVSQDLALLTETLWLIEDVEHNDEAARAAFPKMRPIPSRITTSANSRTPNGWRKVVSKTRSGNDYFRSETTKWQNTFRLGPQRAALANLPEDQERFPITTWFKRYISEGVQRIMLNSVALRRPSPPQSPRVFLPDGSNLPWVVSELSRNDPELLEDWVRHVRTALPTVRQIKTIERPEDRHRYLVVEYDSGLEAPSWVVSDGTLRMLALTIMAYLPNLEGIFLIEEPENGIHPRAVETVYQALSTIDEAQVFLATHSPIILSMAEPSALLCFDRTTEGETDIVSGSKHPRLKDWHGEVNLGTLFAAGVLG